MTAVMMWADAVNCSTSTARFDAEEINWTQACSATQTNNLGRQLGAHKVACPGHVPIVVILLAFVPGTTEMRFEKQATHGGAI